MQTVYAVVADQRRSRRGADRVPAALERLASVPVMLPYERTAGDEIQGLISDPAAVVDTVVRLTRGDDWRIGVGIGQVDEPVPTSTRAARGTAYLAARAAIDASRGNPTGLAVRCAPESGYGADDVRDAEAALWLLRAVLDRRTEEGWQIVDLHMTGVSGTEAARALDISPSAVSQRLRRSAHAEAQAGVRLATRLVERIGLAS